MPDNVRWVLVLGILSCASFAGCREQDELPGPPTVPVSGKVVMASGGTVEKLAARGISVAFQSVEQPAVNATGIINDDGTFHMSTFVEGGIKPGVIEGKHRVCLKAEGTTESIVPPKFRSFAASKMVVTIPSEQEIVLDVSR